MDKKKVALAGAGALALAGVAALVIRRNGGNVGASASVADAYGNTPWPYWYNIPRERTNMNGARSMGGAPARDVSGSADGYVAPGTTADAVVDPTRRKPSCGCSSASFGELAATPMDAANNIRAKLGELFSRYVDNAISAIPAWQLSRVNNPDATALAERTGRQVDRMIDNPTRSYGGFVFKAPR